MPATCRVYRSKLRGFLKYLYQERKIIKRDLAVLVTSRRSYSQAKPPKFLRPQEIQRLFAGLKLSTPSHIRTYAMIHLAYCLGLRPFEITRITLDDISFRKRELLVKTRKGNNPMTLPNQDRLFINQRGQELTRHGIYRICRKYLEKALPKKRLKTINPVHSFRHTCAVHMLYRGDSVTDIKNHLGHENIQSSTVYLHLDLKRRRQIQDRFLKHMKSVLTDDQKIDDLLQPENNTDIMDWLDSL